jgi:CelD/BcsL family acetyltransferase involved in cellulose biosynthesis
VPALEIEEATTIEGLEKLRPDWSALWARCPTATPFQSPEWLIPWWRHIGQGELWTLALRHRGHLVGLAPFYIYNKPGSPEREVFLVGIATSDYLDALFDRAFAAYGSAVVFAYLDTARQRWDVCDLQRLRSGSPLLHAALPRGWHEEITAQEPCTGLALSGTVGEFPGLIPRRLRKNLRNSWNRAERTGPVRIERAHEENLDELLEALFRLHCARWSSQGLAGVLASEAVRNAHRETAPALLALGVLRLYGLRIADRLVASLYGFTHISAGGTRAYAYLSGFDPAFAQLSVGTLLLGYAVQQAMHEGAAEFDFLRGQETYKSHWRVNNHLTYRRRLWHASD